MPEIDWDDMVVPRNVPIVLRGTNDDGAEVACGICDAGIAWTDDNRSTRAMEFGDLVASFSMHVNRVHRG